jgi:hypothetical protein
VQAYTNNLDNVALEKKSSKQCPAQLQRAKQGIYFDFLLQKNYPKIPLSRADKIEIVCNNYPKSNL